MAQEQWDLDAASFDDEPDHGLTDPRTRAAWRDLLVGVFPPAPARVADLGGGTGTLTRLLIDDGYTIDELLDDLADITPPTPLAEGVAQLEAALRPSGSPRALISGW